MKFLILVLSMLISTSVFASNDAIELCSLEARQAAAVMSLRQADYPPEEIVYRMEERGQMTDLIYTFIEAAYQYDIERTEYRQIKAIESFEDQAFEVCIDSFTPSRFE